MEKHNRRSRSQLADAAYIFLILFTIWIASEVFQFLFTAAPVITAVAVLTALIYLTHYEHRR